MKFSDFLAEGLYDKYYDIPAGIIRVWNSVKEPGLRYPLIMRHLRDVISSKLGEKIDVVITVNDKHPTGGFYSTGTPAKYISINASSKENPTDLDNIVSTFMHEFTHVLQFKDNKNVFVRYAGVTGEGDLDQNARYFFQSAERSPMIYGIIANLAIHDLDLSDVKSFLDSMKSGSDYKKRKIQALKVATTLKLFTDGEQYKMWSYYINTITYAYGLDDYKSIVTKWLDKTFREYGNFLYLKRKFS